MSDADADGEGNGAANAAARIERLPLATDYLCSFVVLVGPTVSLGIGPYGERRSVALLGGWVDGPGLTGRIEPGGHDWQTVRSDGVIDIDAHYGLVLDDGARVEIMSLGMRHAPPDVLARLGRGDAVDPSSYFFRTLIRFETGAARLAHLNRTMAIATGARRPTQVELTLHAIR